jgi:hypothetical protein
MNGLGTITVQARYGYDPYGRTTLVSGTNLATKQYAGMYMHQPSRLTWEAINAMYLQLATTDVWEIKGDFDAIQLFKALPLISVSSDILVIGSYEVEEVVLQWLRANEIELSEHEKPFVDSFDFNRQEYPNGRFYGFHPEENQIEGLANLCKIPNAGVEKNLFFDHFLLYRSGIPIVPLLNFHDAFSGGTLYLSGLYSKQTIQKFTASLGATSEFILNPELKYLEEKKS